ncbi:helix-turn-helix domain-containing protein [Parasaccharibacter sp. TMW2.1890]|uniref:helix-turn-helix domain-containing protein n=1 Tax=Parasaccharibacter sp. TMW2.1890 TaxID=2039289 RepID=UPI0020136616|nr:helix-turn-helix domain-containing protein [Parasaccharibacter sp. TMW2.1890]
MSYATMKWAMEVQATPTQKHVLLVLATHANEDGEAFPSIQSICNATGLSDRAVRKARSELIDAGLLEKSSKFTRNGVRLNMARHAAQPAPDAGKAAPRSEKPAYRATKKEPAPDAATPARHAAQPAPDAGPHNSQLNTINSHTIPPTPQPKKSTASKRGHRLPDDWQPSQELIDYANERNLDPQREAEDFRDYWHSKPGAGGVKLDWAATWRTWCRRSADRQQQRFPGTGNVTPFPARQQRNTRPPRDPFAGFADSFTDVEIPELSPEDKALMRRYRS